MGAAESTCWTVLREAAGGDPQARELFAQHYEPVLRAYLGARWRGERRVAELLPDALQEIFVECLKQGGLLERADPQREGGFRAFLMGAARLVALRFESGRGRSREGALPTAFDAPDEEAHLSQVFDQAWARSVLQRALALQRERALALSGERRVLALGRLELLRLRFQEGLAIRDIAERQGERAELVHERYRQARREYREALLDVVRFELPGAGDDDPEREAARLLEALGG